MYPVGLLKSCFLLHNSKALTGTIQLINKFLCIVDPWKAQSKEVRRWEPVSPRSQCWRKIGVASFPQVCISIQQQMETRLNQYRTESFSFPSFIPVIYLPILNNTGTYNLVPSEIFRATSYSILNLPRHNRFRCLPLTQFKTSQYIKKEIHKNGSISHYKMLSSFLGLSFTIEQ